MCLHSYFRATVLLPVDTVALNSQRHRLPFPPTLTSSATVIMTLDSFYHNKIESMKLSIIEGQAKLRRLEAQRNDYNSRVRLLREELGLLQQPGSYVGEVVKVMGTKKVLVKVHPEGKYGTHSTSSPLPPPQKDTKALTKPSSRRHSRRHRPSQTHSRQARNPPFRQLQARENASLLRRSARLPNDGRKSTR